MSLTPIRKQYLRIKKDFPDAILLFRLGDFYETFDEDAEIVSRVCDIVLTSRPVGKGQRVPLAGVPYHAVNGYIAKLISAGYKVAICEQVGKETVRGLMPREVVRVITAGTVVEPSLLDERKNNYLVALVMDAERAGIAYADITTGEFATTELEGEEIALAVQQELNRLQPAELLLPNEESNDTYTDLTHIPYPITLYDAWRYEYGTARRALLEHFGVSSLAGYGCEDAPMAIRAAGAIIQYLRSTQKAALSQLTRLSTYSTDRFMRLDPSTLRNLELFETVRERSTKGSLLGVLDQTITSMGARLLRRWLGQPLLDLKQLQKRQAWVQVFYDDTPRRVEIRELFKQIGDLERLTNRVVQRIARPRDLLGLRTSLEVVPKIKALLEECVPAITSDLAEEGAVERDETSRYPPELSALDPCEDVASLIEGAISPDAPARISDGGVIAPGYSAELDRITSAAKEARDWVARLERREQERTGIKNLKVGYNKVFGYYIEVSKANLKRVPSDYIRKQTLVNAERFITPELKEHEALILNAQERVVELEQEIYREVCEQVASHADRMLATAQALAHLDVYAALAEVARQNNYVRPVLNEEDRIDIVGGRHPVVEKMLEEPFVPNDVHLSPEERILIITGPNMSGKSTYLRQVALIVLMAQIGSFVPAESATIGLVDRIFTRVGAQDEIAAGQSTFMVEMIETANILNHATPRSLLILDEIGRGTSTYDGISIAWAVVEYIHNHPKLGSKTLFATHYHELTELARMLPRVRNYNVAVVEEGDQVIFLRKIKPGGADRSYGIHVAKLAGMPRSVIRRAEEILASLEQEGARAPIKAQRVAEAQQLSFLSTTSPVLEELKSLDVMSMSPLEALSKLYELQQKAEE